MVTVVRVLTHFQPGEGITFLESEGSIERLHSASVFDSMELGVAFEGPAVAFLNGILYIVVRRLGGTIWFGRYDTQAGAFLGWVKLDGATPSSPALVAANGNLYLAVRGLAPVHYPQQRSLHENHPDAR
jgi:hypothetical protein